MSDPTASTITRSLAVVSHEATRTGAPISLLNLTEALRDSGGWSPTFLSARPGPLVPRFAAIGPTAVIGGSSTLQSRVRYRLPSAVRVGIERRAMSAWLDRISRPAVVYVNTITMGHLADVAARRGLPVVTHVHEMGHSVSSYARSNVIAGALAASSLLLAASESNRRSLIEDLGADPNRVVTAYEAVSTYTGDRARGRADVRRELGVADSDVIVLGVGTIGTRKGTDLFASVAGRISAIRPDIRFVWVGGGRQPADPNVTFVSEIDVPAEMYRAADLYFLSSREDPYPLVMIEAAAEGLPVIGFRSTGGVDEFLADGGGVLVDAFALDDAASAIERLADDRDRRTSLARQARRAAARRSPEQTAALVGRLLNEVAADAPR